MLEGVADSMASVILRNATSFGETDDAAGAGSEPGISKAAFLILVFEAFRAHPAGYVGFLFFLTFWTTLAMPVTPLEICAGCVFGPYWGTAGSLFAKTMGCTCALFVGRYMGESQGWKMPQAMEQYLGLLKTRPFQAMCAVRVAPIPQGVKNYGLSLVRFPNGKYPVKEYIWACFIVGAPYSVMWGLTGHGASSLVDVVSKYA
mmetsp:Transcript_24350/g.58001  ORF Transcript_24350/g.58001 Transcript_24350/m.58001 type:complete len:203 (+) Transcript_24350:79-687(+)